MNSHDAAESADAWENQQHVPVTHFDFSAFDVPITVKLTKAQQAILEREAMLATALLRLATWLAGGKSKHSRKSGAWLRVQALVWLVDGEVRNEPLAAFARRHGLTKQNMQRTMVQFRDEFGYRDGRFYCPQARASARQREEEKRNHTKTP